MEMYDLPLLLIINGRDFFVYCLRQQGIIQINPGIYIDIALAFLIRNFFNSSAPLFPATLSSHPPTLS